MTIPARTCSGPMVTAESTGGEGTVLQTGPNGSNRWVSAPGSRAGPLSARERRDTNWNPSRSNCGLLRRKPEDIVVWSPSLVMSLQIDTATFIPEESSASGSVVANGLGGHHAAVRRLQTGLPIGFGRSCGWRSRASLSLAVSTSVKTNTSSIPSGVRHCSTAPPQGGRLQPNVISPL